MVSFDGRPESTMHVIVCPRDSEDDLSRELAQEFPGAVFTRVHPAMFSAEFPLVAGQQLPFLAFGRQFLPQARSVGSASIRGWAQLLVGAMLEELPEQHPWSLHVEPLYGAGTARRLGARAWYSVRRHGAQKVGPHSLEGERSGGSEAGRHRCQLVREAVLGVLQQKRRSLLRHLRESQAPFLAGESLVQLLLIAPETGFLSISPAPLPFEQRHLVSPFPMGEVVVPEDKAAPSRAFVKLAEAEHRFGCAIQRGESCVDLGAAPGSWTYIAVDRGAQVIAVDRSRLREDLMSHPQVQFHAGDGFRFRPSRAVDWLLCDVIAPAERSAELLLEWLRCGWCRKFVVTLKLKDTAPLDGLDRAKRELPSLTRELWITRLCANKKEVCVFGAAK